jgi:hypothetical protein
MILSAPRNRSADVIRKFIHVHERAVDVTMQAKLVPRSDYFLRDLGIPFSDFANEIDACFGVSHLFKDGIQST